MRRAAAIALWLTVLCQLTHARTLAQSTTTRYLQVSIALNGKCSDAALAGFNRVFQARVRGDVQQVVGVTVSSTGTNPPSCRNVKNIVDPNDLANYASFVARVQWRQASSARLSLLFNAANRGRSSCRVGIQSTYYKTTLAAIAATGKTIKANAASRSSIAMSAVAPCNKAPVPSPSPAPSAVDCVGSWSEYSACNVTACGQSGFQTSTYSITVPASNGGKPCEAKQGDTRQLACNTTACPPPPANCSSIPDSQLDAAENKCKCTKAGFTIPALNKDGLLDRCLADGTTTCPATHPVVVKDSSTAVVKVMSCLADGSSCPAPYTFPLWGGNPSVLKECRTPIPGCGYSGYGVPVYDGLDTVNPKQLGCAASNSDACPFVAYRSTTKQFALEDCRKITTCPQYTATSTEFTVPAYGPDGLLKSCLTLAPNGQCPESSPIEVFLGSSLNCGSAALPCQAASSRTVQCLASNATCPPEYSLELWRVTGSPAKSELVQCRQARQSCDLTAAGMSASDVNAGVFDVPIAKADLLAGCIAANPTGCPPNYPQAKRQNGAVMECRPADGTQITCPDTAPVPIRNIAGNTIDCVARSGPCPDSNPITVRSGTQAKLACLAPGSSCPADYNFGFYAPTGDGKSTVLTNCFKREDIVVTANPTCTVTISDGPSGTVGNYGKMIKSNATGTLQLQGCMLGTTSVCPSAFSFGVYNGVQLSECRASTGIVGCATGIPAYDQGVLNGCVTIGADKTCPDTFPVEVKDAMGAAGNVLECVTSTTKCSQTAQRFSVVNGETLDSCVPPTPGQSQCSGVNDLEIFSPDGNSLVGCVSGSTTCPKLFPITFYNINADTAESCRASLSGTCSVASAGEYPITLYGADNTLAGCIKKGSTQCGGANRVVVSKTALDNPEACYPDTTTGCSFPGYSFPLYGGNAADKLARCIQPPTGALDCSTGFGVYTAAIYSNAQGTGTVAGCIVPTTPCPTGAPFAYLSAASALESCRPQGAVACPSTHTVRLEQNATALLGCMRTAATACPTSGATVAPFTLYGTASDTTSNTAVINICRVASTPALSDCSSEPTYPVKVYGGDIATPGNLIGCKANSAFCPTVGGAATLMFASGVGSSFSVTGCYKLATGTTTCPAANYVPLCDDSTVSDAAGTVGCTNLKGCVSLLSSNRRCPSTLVGSPVTYPFFVVDIPAAAPTLANGDIKGCFKSGSTCPATTYTVKARDSSSTSSPIMGCTDQPADPTLCQSYWRLYKVSATNDEVCTA